MQWNEEAEEIMKERFGGDNEMALATCRGSVPSVRTVNATYWEGCFYVITYGLSRKMEEIGDNPTVALSGDWFTCHGEAASLGWLAGRKTRPWPPTCAKPSPAGLTTATTTFPTRTPSSCRCG